MRRPTLRLPPYIGLSEFILILVAIVVLTVSLIGFSRNHNDAVHIQGQSDLTNCLAIEQIKGRIRQVVRDSKEQTRHLRVPGFTQQNRQQALANADATIARFAPKNCYLTPSVVHAGIKPPSN